MNSKRIGARRWQISLYERAQIPDPNSAGIIETPAALETVWANIEPLGALVFYGAVTASGPEAPTHRITTRWIDYIDTRHAFTRITNRPDSTVRTEIYRVRRVTGDLDGRKRFSICECQLESSI